MAYKYGIDQATLRIADILLDGAAEAGLTEEQIEEAFRKLEEIANRLRLQ